MSSVLKFELKEETKLDKNFKPMDKTSVGLYACVDGLESWVTSVDTIEEVREAINPNNIDDLFSESLSEDESEIIYAVLNTNQVYYFFDEKFTYIKEAN